MLVENVVDVNVCPIFSVLAEVIKDLFWKTVNEMLAVKFTLCSISLALILALELDIMLY